MNQQILNILLASPIDSEVITELKKNYHLKFAFNESPAVLKKRIQNCQILIFRSGVQISADVMASSSNLRLIIRAGSGIDNIDMAYVRRNGIKLLRVSEPGAQAVAEMSFAFMLALSRKLLEADRLTKQGQWAKHELAGYLLKGKVLGVVGLGNIGLRVAQMGVAWGMQAIGCVERPSSSRTEALFEKGIKLVGFDQVISTSDFICLHTPRKAATLNLINAEVLSRVKPGAFLVNLARGGVVDEKALCRALTKNRLSGAALDVHEHEGQGKISLLAKLPNVILTPHIGAMTIDSQHEIGRRIHEIINAFAIAETNRR